MGGINQEKTWFVIGDRCGGRHDKSSVRLTIKERIIRQQSWFAILEFRLNSWISNRTSTYSGDFSIVSTYLSPDNMKLTFLSSVNMS